MEEKPIVEAYGIGKTGFINTNINKEEAIISSAQIDRASTDQTE